MVYPGDGQGELNQNVHSRVRDLPDSVPSRARTRPSGARMRAIILWLIGVPISAIILLKIFGFL